jgi:hypothetical protein
MVMKRKLYLILALMLSVASLKAQKFTAAASATEVGVGDVFQVEWSVDGNGGNFSLPGMPEFEVAGGPSQGSSVSIVNGHMSQSMSITYAFRAKKAGSFQIPPANIRVGNAVLKSNAINIKVVQGSGNGGGGNGSNTQQRRNGSNQPAGADRGNGDAEYFIDASVDKSNIMEGEPITVTYKLYLRNVQPQGQGITAKKAPSFTGFWVKDLPDATDKELRPEDRNGKRYFVAIVKKAILYPQHSGILTVDPMEWEATLAMRGQKRRANNGFFDDPFFDDFFQQPEVYHKILQSNPVPIKVNALPEAGKPQNFSGLVGNFHVRANVDKTKLKENDAITYRITVEGQGNLQQVQPFSLNLPPDWDVYDPKTVDKTGSKTFEYTIIPKKMGKYTLPSVDFSYFDLNSHRYITDKTKEFEIEVLKGNGTSSGSAISYDKEDVKMLGQDIRFIKISSGGLSKEGNIFYNSGLFWLLGVSPFLLFAGLLIFRRKNEEMLADVAGSRKRKATGMARKRLKTAKIYLQKADKPAFYTEVLMALYGYIQNKIGLQLAETSRDAIREVLVKHQAKEQEISRFLQIVDTCEFAKYASGAVTENLSDVYNQSVELITNLEGQLK